MASIAIEQDESTIHEQILLPPQEIERLYQIAQTGVTSSIGSLRDFLGTNAEIHLNCLSFLPLPVLIDRIKLFYTKPLGFHLRFTGEITGEIYTFFREEDTLILIEQMTGHKRNKNNKGLNRIEISVLAELVNILSNSFWRALTEKTSLNWWFTPPTYVNDLNRSLAYSAKIYTLDHLLIHFEYFIPSMQIRIQFIMLPTQHTMKKILAKLSLTPSPEND